MDSKKSNAINNQTSKLFENLKLILQTPRLYICNYFNRFRKDIDLFFIKRIIVETNTKTKAKLNRNWIEIIHKVDLFEAKCHRNQANNHLDKLLISVTDEKICSFELSLNDSNLELRQIIQEQIYKLERILFLNRTIFFIDSINYSGFDSFKRMDLQTTVGKLIICTNEYFDNRSLKQLYKKYNQYFNNLI